MYKLGIVLVIILLFFSSAKTSKAQDSLLILRLNQAVEDDQEIRLQVRSALNSGANRHIIDSLVLEMHSVDSINFVFLKETVEKHRFPGISIIGSSGAKKFWLLIQHQDLNPEFQKQLLVLMKVAVEQKEANASDYAYLYDRVCVNSGNLQLYGTQLQLNADSTSYVTKPVVSPDSLDIRRAQVQLPPMQFYIEQMNKQYFGTIKQLDR